MRALLAATIMVALSACAPSGPGDDTIDQSVVKTNGVDVSLTCRGGVGVYVARFRSSSGIAVLANDPNCEVTP